MRSVKQGHQSRGMEWAKTRAMAGLAALASPSQAGSSRESSQVPAAPAKADAGRNHVAAMIPLKPHCDRASPAPFLLLALR